MDPEIRENSRILLCVTVPTAFAIVSEGNDGTYFLLNSKRSRKSSVSKVTLRRAVTDYAQF